MQKQKDKLWKLYAHINKENGKTYVGVTSKQNPNHRWNSGRGYKENPHFYSAIEKYGWDGFDHIIILDGISEADAKSWERALISIWHTQNPQYGYNMTSGGDGTPDYHPNSVTRAKLSEARKKENLSPETLERRSMALRGRKFTDEHRDKIRKSLSKPIIMLTEDGVPLQEFFSARDAENILSISHAHVSQCCNGHRLSAGGYKWKFA